MTGVNGVKAQTLADGIKQHGVERGTVEREVARRIPCVESRRLTVNELPEPAEKAKLLRLDSDGGQCGAEPEFIETLNRVGEEIKPYAQLFEFASRFVDLGLDPVLVQIESRREAADAAADDHDTMVLHASILQRCRMRHVRPGAS